jgi:Arc/MetJ-type ribon-helix-helix transcriptional regulator
MNPEDESMAKLMQKKVTISPEQIEFLENYRQWGFTDQSSIVREALARFIRDLKTKQRKNQMAEKAKELLSDYKTDKELTTFADLDSEDFL